ncbi:Tripartite ATP-independent periplasmic transporter, DctQ component [Shimia sp. SK013]|uniref:TRAP transporter small permease n=1 Tax=Shimia sp. SK013 TaxID=1389006 RepID=UPI0006B65D0F|nr:TRAP transporter small permease [Shimia sp. SK013]KPA21773.1 Tripartite ATP-independent periplasmic transporter, DctQ component [Shimia sp. SK013]
MKEQSNIPKPIEFLDRGLIWTSLIFGGLTLVFMTAFSVWNVLIMRKALNSPVLGAEDLLILSLVVIVAFSIPLGARTGAHIEIEVLESQMSARFAKWSMIFVKLLGVGLLIVTSWRLWHAAGTAQKFGETTQQLLISYQPFYYLLSISAGLYAIVVCLDIWQMLRSGRVQYLHVGGGAL